MLDQLKQFERELDRELPPYGQNWLYDAAQDYPDQLYLCLYFDKSADFADLYHYEKDGTSHFDHNEFARRLREWKKSPVDYKTLPVRLLFNHKVLNMSPLTPDQAEAQNSLLRDTDIGKNLDVSGLVSSYFTEQSALGNFQEGSEHKKNITPSRPDKTVSTDILCTFMVNPRLGMIGINLSGRQFFDDGVFFESANFRAADLRKTQWDLETTSIKGALLEGANLRGAEGLSEQTLAHCYIDARTKLPTGMRLENILALQAELNLSPAPAFTELEIKYMPKARQRPRQPAPEWA